MCDGGGCAGFKPTFRGRLVPNRPPLQGQQIRQLGLMVRRRLAGGCGAVGLWDLGRGAVCQLD